MQVHFYSYINKEKSQAFISEATLINNKYVFEDKSTQDTTISFEVINNNHIIIERNGKVSSSMAFKLNEETFSNYKSNELDFIFKILTKEIKVLDTSISIDYDFFYDNECVGSTKIVLLIKNDLKKSKL